MFGIHRNYEENNTYYSHKNDGQNGILDKKEEVIEMGNVHPGQIKLQR